MTIESNRDALDPIEQFKRIDPQRLQADIAETERHLALLRHLTKALAAFADPGEASSGKPQAASKRGKRATQGSLIEPVTACLRQAEAPMRYADIARAIGANKGGVWRMLTGNPELFVKTKDKTWGLK